MHGRFTCPQMSDVPEEQWPDHFTEEPTELMGALHSSNGLQIHIEPTMLRQWDNHDMNMSLRMWDVSILIREIGTDQVMRFRSCAPVLDGDSPDRVGLEFASAVIRSIHQMLQEEQEDSDGIE